MATPRLTFLYPHLFRSLRIGESSTPFGHFRDPRPSHVCGKTRSFSTTQQPRVKFAERRGKGVEPIAVESEAATSSQESPGSSEEADKTRDAKSKFREAVETESQRAKAEKESNAASTALSEETQAAARLPGYDEETGKAIELPLLRDEQPSPRQTAAANTQDTVGMDTILEMPPPESAEEENKHKPPHLQTPPYVHHFDTYTLVKRVEEGGFTEQQAITTMKAVRGLLAENLGVAKEGLVSKSDVENETYLFRAACSELKTEISNLRSVRDETMRRERTLLQHENDILNQKLTQELQTMREDMKGVFDDRKMTVRTEQRAMDSKIQELNYKITVLLNSDSKSEIEGLRWVLTRRSVMGILFMAFMVLTSLRYASYKSHENDVKKKKKDSEEKEESRLYPKNDLVVPGAEEILAAN